MTANTEAADDWTPEHLLAFLDALSGDMEAGRPLNGMRLFWQVTGHASQLRAYLAAAPHLVAAAPDAALREAVLAERASCVQCCKDAMAAAESTYGVAEGVGAHIAMCRILTRSAAPLPPKGSEI